MARAVPARRVRAPQRLEAGNGAGRNDRMKPAGRRARKLPGGRLLPAEGPNLPRSTPSPNPPPKRSARLARTSRKPTRSRCFCRSSSSPRHGPPPPSPNLRIGPAKSLPIARARPAPSAGKAPGRPTPGPPIARQVPLRGDAHPGLPQTGLRGLQVTERPRPGRPIARLAPGATGPPARPRTGPRGLRATGLPGPTSTVPETVLRVLRPTGPGADPARTVRPPGLRRGNDRPPARNPTGRRVTRPTAARRATRRPSSTR
jgi:hypothetical protein